MHTSEASMKSGTMFEKEKIRVKNELKRNARERKKATKPKLANGTEKEKWATGMETK